MMRKQTGIIGLTILGMLTLGGCLGPGKPADGTEPAASVSEHEAVTETSGKAEPESVTGEEPAAEDLEGMLKQVRGSEIDYDKGIFDSDQRLFTLEELRAMPAEVLAVFRNELYARHGRMFTKNEWQEFFGAFSWYDGKYAAGQFDEKQLTAMEKDNLKLVLSVEAERSRPAIFTTADYPRVDGSTATIPLSEQLAADAMGIPVEEARLYILHNKTHSAYVNLIEGKADIIFVTAPSEGELELAARAGVELEVHPVVKEGFVFLVNEQNPVQSLTQRQIKDIYTGKITSWKEAGGEEQPIIAHQRPENSGSQSGMLSLVMKDTPMMKAPLDLYVSEMGELIESVLSYTNDGNAIGYSYYYYVSSMYFRKGVRLMAIDGVVPEPETIRNGSYPYTTAYYAVIKKSEPSDSGARKLLDWTLRHGKSSIEEAGYVPLS